MYYCLNECNKCEGENLRNNLRVFWEKGINRWREYYIIDCEGERETVCLFEKE